MTDQIFEEPQFGEVSWIEKLMCVVFGAGNIVIIKGKLMCGVF